MRGAAAHREPPRQSAAGRRRLFAGRRHLRLRRRHRRRGAARGRGVTAAAAAPFVERQPMLGLGQRGPELRVAAARRRHAAIAALVVVRRGRVIAVMGEVVGQIVLAHHNGVVLIARVPVRLAGRPGSAGVGGRRCAGGAAALLERGVRRADAGRRRPAVVRTGVERMRNGAPGGPAESEAGGTAAAQQRGALRTGDGGRRCGDGDGGARQQRAGGRRCDGGGRQVLAEFGEDVGGGGGGAGGSGAVQRIAGMGQLVAGLVAAGSFVERPERDW